ncbi:hypothetical protein HPY86_05825 [candidate division WOR-3 bacterium]|nr:hypothetical protein [candidate division WOR-3 bacterium]
MPMITNLERAHRVACRTTPGTAPGTVPRAPSYTEPAINPIIQLTFYQDITEMGDNTTPFGKVTPAGIETFP